MRPFPVLSVAVAVALSAALTAQSVPLAIEADAKTRTYEVDTLSEVTSKRSITMNGQEMGGRFGGASGSSPTTTSQHVVFAEAPAWRRYDALSASITRDDREGNPQTRTITGGLEGKKVVFDRTGEDVVMRDGAADGDLLDARLTRGLPTSVVLGGLAPNQAVRVGKTFEIGEGFQVALKNLLHPVRAAASQQVPAEGGAEPSPRRGGRRGGGRGRARSRGVTDVALRTLVNDDLLCRVTGKLEAVETVDGRKMAIVAFTGTITGQGDPAELGMMGGGGRGGRGGGAAAAMEGSASVDIGVEGRLVIDVEARALAQLTVKGAMETSMATSRTLDRGGQSMELAMASSSSGTFIVTVLSY